MLLTVCKQYNFLKNNLDSILSNGKVKSLIDKDYLTLDSFRVCNAKYILGTV